MASTNCPICFNDYDYDNYIPNVVQCGHTFCHHCIDDWMRSNHNTCPNCRVKIISVSRNIELINLLGSLTNERNEKSSFFVIHGRSGCTLLYYIKQEYLKRILVWKKCWLSWAFSLEVGQVGGLGSILVSWQPTFSLWLVQPQGYILAARSWAIIWGELRRNALQ